MKNSLEIEHHKFAVVMLFLSALVFLLLAAESAIRLFYPWISNYDLEMFRYAAYGKMPCNDPGLSHQHRPGAYFESLYGVEVKINSKGLREYEYSYETPPHVYKILVLGDSITFGWGVPFGDTYAKLLEKKLNESKDGAVYQVINSGVGNYQIKDEVSFLKQEGLKYNPDMVILGYFIDDAAINRKIRFFNLKRYSYLYAFLLSHWNALHTNFVPRRAYYYYSKLYANNSETLNNLKSNIAELKSIVGARNTPLLVILIPDIHALKNYPFKGIHKLVANEFGSRNNIRVLDLLPFFDMDVAPQSYWVSREDPHHNSKAHKIIAAAIYPEVKTFRLAHRPAQDQE